MNSEELKRPSVMVEIFEGDAVANFNGSFNLKMFKLSLIDDSKVIALSETGDPFLEYELSEIIVSINDFGLIFDHYDEDEIRN
jgi:hypothetical protein